MEKQIRMATELIVTQYLNNLWLSLMTTKKWLML